MLSSFKNSLKLSSFTFGLLVLAGMALGHGLVRADDTSKDRFYELDAPYPDMKQGPNGGIGSGEMTPNKMGVLAGSIKRSLMPDALTGKSQYSDNELTYAPELWKAAIIWQSAYKVDWHVKGGADCEFCEAFLKDFKAWKHIRVIEPIARSNEFGHKKFEKLHKECKYSDEPHYFITPPGIFGDEGRSPPAYGTWGFRWYKIPSGVSYDVDLFLYQDAALLLTQRSTSSKGVFQRLNGPIRKSDIDITEGDGIHGSLFNIRTGCKTRHNVLQGYDIKPFSLYAYQHLTKQEFDEGLQALAVKMRRPENISLSEMAVITYKGQVYFLITNLNFHSETGKDNRTLQLVAGPDKTEHPYYEGVGAGFYDALKINTGALKASFEADIGDVRDYFKR